MKRVEADFLMRPRAVAPLDRAGRGLKRGAHVFIDEAVDCRPARSSGAWIETAYRSDATSRTPGRPARSSGAWIETRSRKCGKSSPVRRPARSSGAWIETAVPTRVNETIWGRPARSSGAWIETDRTGHWIDVARVAPLDRAGRGLKRQIPFQPPPRIGVAPLDRAGRGLKLR